MVKRIIGLPGDTVAMRNNRLFINGQAVNYEPLDPCDAEPGTYPFEEKLDGRPHAIMLLPIPLSKSSFASTRIPDGHYFVMGDNRDNSRDSRYFGFVEGRRIVGRASAVVLSLDKHRSYRPRWGRFFSELR